MPAQAIPSRYALELKHNRPTDQDISLGENAFEGSDDICHPLTLWEVCVQVAGSMVANRRSVARAKRNAARLGARAALTLSLHSGG